MKKWENHLILKNYSNKIRNAKPNLKLSKPSAKPSSELKAQVSSKSSKAEIKKPRILESAGSNKSSISDYYEFEKVDLINIPLYRLLKLYNLQQYAKQLISRGFGYDLQKFMFLSKKELENLILDIKVMPGHKTKLLKLLDYINSLFISLDQRPQFARKMEKTGERAEKSNISDIYLKSKSASSLVRKKSLLKTQNTGKDEIKKETLKGRTLDKGKFKLQNVGCDFFTDSYDVDDDFSKTLEKIMNKYQNSLSNNKAKNPSKTHSQSPPKLNDLSKKLSKPTTKPQIRPKALDHELITAPKSKLLLNLKKTFANSTKNEFDIGLEYNQIKNLYISFDSGKMTSTLINLDIEEMTFCLACVLQRFIEYGENHDEIPFISPEKQSESKENYQISLDFKKKAKVDDSRNFDLSDKIIETPQKQKDSFLKLQNRIKNYDKVQKSSTSYLQKEDFYEEFEEKSGEKTEEEEENSNLNIANSKFENPRISRSEEEFEEFEEDYVNNELNPEDRDEIEFEQSKREIESILKESLLVSSHPENLLEKPPLKNTATFKNVTPIQEEDKNYDTNKENGDNEENEDNSYNICYQSRMEENSKVNVSLCSKITYFDETMNNELSFSRDLEGVFNRAFNEKSKEKWITAKPSKDTISNFCKNIIITSKMEKEVTIICLIYIEKLIVKSGFHMTSINWRRIVFIALVLASKLWDDESYENDNFAQAFPQYTTKEINSIEMVFLKFINFDLYINSSEYAKYYFILRTFAEKNKKSFPLKPLDINTIISLQNNANNAQKTLKEMYMNSLNKTF